MSKYGGDELSIFYYLALYPSFVEYEESFFQAKYLTMISFFEKLPCSVFLYIL